MQQKWNQNFDGELMPDIPQKFLNAGCDVYMVMQLRHDEKILDERYRSDDTMVDKFSQVAGNVPVTNNDPNRRYTVINGYPVVLNFAKEPNPGVFERVRDILLATSYTKKTS